MYRECCGSAVVAPAAIEVRWKATTAKPVDAVRQRYVQMAAGAAMLLMSYPAPRIE